MGPDSLPPHRLLSTVPIPSSSASTILSTYLANSEAHPHLHPDALITPTGVTFSSHGGPTGGVIMHNLRRIAAGLRGEYLEPEKTPEPEAEEVESGKQWKGKDKRKNIEVAGGEEGWQNMSEYERDNETEGLVVGDWGERDTFVAQGADVNTAVRVGRRGRERARRIRKRGRRRRGRGIRTLSGRRLRRKRRHNGIERQFADFNSPFGAMENPVPRPLYATEPSTVRPNLAYAYAFNATIPYVPQYQYCTLPAR
ncbi:hypothetical protein P154DRAFT_528054 [Amniculicola lignicola CBS 123094]|uniref:Uncharacterized protein n=1 Tax=Amniculicola lignicola CBS 123094 TaxID=1392246 RepID=A0A6A5VU83_9PLEO|nr:hypothetical protein P154DRAFT_528054 [Amniculicola lignicola CBS 123094]